MLTICDKGKCSACNACINICPQNCISLKISFPDETTYAIIEKDKCINCKNCINVCPINHYPQFHKTITCYSGWSLDDEIRNRGASGGIATEIYRYAATENFYFAGVSLDEKREAVFSLKYKEGWKDFQNSKYVYSNTKNVYREIEQKLKDKKKVIFVGLPCQVAGLRNYVSIKKIDISKLITIDLICHGVTPPIFLRKHINAIEEKYSRTATDICFRDPRYLTHSYTFTCSDESGVFYKKKVYRNDSYQIAYHAGIAYRNNCYHCLFSTKSRMGDITLADFGGVGKRAECSYNNENVSCILTNTELGEKLIQNLSQQKYIYIEKRPIEEEYETEPRLLSPTPVPKEREQFLKLYEQESDFEYAIKRAARKKILTNELKYRLKINKAKRTIYKLIPVEVKTIIKKIRQ